MLLLQRKPNPLWSYCLPLEGKAPLCSSFSKTSFPSTFSNPSFPPEMMGESTFEFSVNEYSWQPKVTFWPFQLLSTSLVDPSFLQGPTVPAPEELEPHLWMLHGKQQFNDKSIQWWYFLIFRPQWVLFLREGEQWDMQSTWTDRRLRTGQSQALEDPFKDFQPVFFSSTI